VPDSIAPTRRAIRLQFGMQSILRTIVGIAIVLWLLDFWVRAPYRAEQQAAANLVHAGGKVLLVEDTQGWAPRYVGRSLFDTRIAAMVDLSHSRVTDADLVNLRSFDRVGQLNLSDTAITNAGLVHLRHVVAGRFIDLSRTGVTDIAPLFGPKALDHPSGLKLSGNQIDPGTFRSAFLRAGFSLQDLDLSETNATDQTLAEFPDGLPNLSRLDLSGTNVTDAGLADLHRLTGLTTLGLCRTKVTAEGVAGLKARWKGRSPLLITTGSGVTPIIDYAPFPEQK
jgi:uncharacterized protein YjbI with pentapeptide repeats